VTRLCQLLCLSGGGYLGLYTASVLAELEKASGKPLRETFDLLAGTSVGGIIALGLAAGTSAADIRDAFIENGSAIFSNLPPPQGEVARLLDLRRNFKKAKYRTEPLKAVIEDIVGANLLVGDLGQRVIVPAVNLTKGRPQVFKTPHHPTFIRDLHLKVVDVALATSAAPTFFPVHQIGGELFADGGLYANSPDFLALHEAEYFLATPVEQVRMLSIGTTTGQFSFSNATGKDLGWADWLAGQRLTSAMIASHQINTDAMLKHRLADRYLRIDQIQSREQERHLALDVATDAAKNDMLGLAEASVREFLPKAFVKTVLAHSAGQPKYYTVGGGT